MNQYTFGELKKIILEQGELKYKPVIGKNVIKDDAHNNTQAVNNINKEVKKHIPETEKKNKKSEINDHDFNKTTLDYDFQDKPSSEYVDRVKSQSLGYSSSKEKNNNIDKATDFSANKEFYNSVKNRKEKVSGKKTDIKHAGLKSHNLNKDDFKKNNMFKENIKKLYFKHTKFLSENNMIEKIPENYKTNNNVFIMKDCEGTEYKIKWVQNEEFNYGNPVILSKINEHETNKDINRIKNLFEYKTPENSTNTELRNQENDFFVNLINEIRKNK